MPQGVETGFGLRWTPCLPSRADGQIGAKMRSVAVGRTGFFRGSFVAIGSVSTIPPMWWQPAVFCHPPCHSVNCHIVNCQLHEKVSVSKLRHRT
ncbi:unnamed protein product [Soboliphyme baturini]|uniref:Uncharacterized protein n=1 Tax=Soboliphyme baturini TaxID=241478 RepID=A0A183ICE2_9BILA|nr:unnamed protein product [Soboliphyme baturini]